jgi:hypothetical protein
MARPHRWPTVSAGHQPNSHKRASAGLRLRVAEDTEDEADGWEPPEIENLESRIVRTVPIVSSGRRCGSCAPRCWGNGDNRSRKELGRLHDHAVALAVLLMSIALGQPEAVYVTPEHKVSL